MGSGDAAIRIELADQARALPSTPGVYLMKGGDDTILYVGKASSLKSRVGSYFTPSVDLGPRKQQMLDKITSFDVIECTTEWEAVLTEQRLIKDIRPKFNSLSLDDKTLPYLVITTREPSPGVYITRTPGEGRLKSGRVYGPFASSGALWEAYRVMQRIFRFRSCTLAIDPEDPANAHFRPCLLHAIGQCSAPCANRITPQAYRRDIDRVVRFMSSGRTTVLRELTQEMEEASGEREYERAGVLRDQIEAIKKLDERPDDKTSEPDWQPEVTNPRIDWEESMRSLQRALSIQTPIRCVEGFDVAHLDGQETVASKVCFIDGRPFRDAYRRYRIQMATNDDYMALREVVSRRYRRVSEGLEIFPDLVLIDGGRGQLNAAMAAFGLLGIEPPLIVSLAKKEEEVYRPGSSEPLRLGRSNPGLRLLQAVRDEAHRFAQHYHHILRKKRFLDQ